MEQESTSGSGYGKRPLWHWILIYLVFAVVVYGLIYYFVIAKRGGYAPGYDASSPQAYPGTKNYPSQSQPAPAAEGQALNPARLPISPKSENVVTYGDSGFSPSTITVKKGDSVIFKNTMPGGMWVASNPHPVHNAYPTTGGCITSTFDSCTGIPAGQSWSFTFDKVGTWKYHNHLHLNQGGTIVVQ